MTLESIVLNRRITTTLMLALVASLLLVVTPRAHAANACTDFAVIDNAPVFQYPSKSSFRSFWNRLLARLEPFHMAHDLIVAEGEPSVMVGKFDYDAYWHKDLEYEDVNVYIHGTDLTQWYYLGRYRTNWDGKIYAHIPPLPEGQYQVRMVVRGDLSETTGYVTVIRQGARAVVFDIDETLTISDFEQIGDYTGLSTAQARGGAAELVQHYVSQGYHPIFVTGRTYWYARGTRQWLADYLGVPHFTLRHSKSNRTGIFRVAEYKTAELEGFIDSGVDILRAYGNASTDIEAYQNVGIANEDIYIVGRNAGNDGSQPISEGHFWNHLYEVAYPDTPHSGCQ